MLNKMGEPHKVEVSNFIRHINQSQQELIVQRTENLAFHNYSPQMVQNNIMIIYWETKVNQDNYTIPIIGHWWACLDLFQYHILNKLLTKKDPDNPDCSMGFSNCNLTMNRIKFLMFPPKMERLETGWKVLLYILYNQEKESCQDFPYFNQSE